MDVKLASNLMNTRSDVREVRRKDGSGYQRATNTRALKVDRCHVVDLRSRRWIVVGADSE